MGGTPTAPPMDGKTSSLARRIPIADARRCPAVGCPVPCPRACHARGSKIADAPSYVRSPLQKGEEGVGQASTGETEEPLGCAQQWDVTHLLVRPLVHLKELVHGPVGRTGRVGSAGRASKQATPSAPGGRPSGRPLRVPGSSALRQLFNRRGGAHLDECLDNSALEPSQVCR